RVAGAHSHCFWLMCRGPVQKFFWSTNRFFGSDFMSTGGGDNSWRISAGLGVTADDSVDGLGACAMRFKPGAKRTRPITRDPKIFANCCLSSGLCTSTSQNLILGPLDD